MRISNETKEQIKKSEGKFFANVSKVVMQEYIDPEELFKDMGMKCPESESESIYDLFSAMRICEKYKNEYWYTVFRYAIFFKKDILKFYRTHQQYFKTKKSMYNAWLYVDDDLKYLLDEEV